MPVLVRWLLTLAVVPLLSLALSQHTLRQNTDEARQALSQDTAMGAQDPVLRQQIAEFDYTDFALQECGALGFNTEPVRLSSDFCWYALQPTWATRISVVLLGLAAVLAALVALALMVARRGPAHELHGLRLGWAALQAFVIPQIVGQAALAVYLGFWTTAVFAGFYSTKLIAVIAVVSFAGVGVALKALARRPGYTASIYGVVVKETDAPRFFATLGEIASKVRTTPPDNVVLGMDDNFFVTEVPMIVSGQLDPTGGPAKGGTRICGRTLFASISLMQILESKESEAILAHELGHLAAGDTQRAASLTSRLQRCTAYAEAIDESFTFGVSAAFEYFLDSFRRIQAKTSRSAELDADATAARAVGAEEFASALVKVTAYSSYRTQQEGSLIEAMTEHEGLDIQHRVRNGFDALLCDDEFRTSILEDSVPHPYDQHPPLVDRLENIAMPFPSAESSSPTAGLPAGSLTELIPCANAVGDRLWSQYQERFTTAHRELIALQLRPTTAEEIEQVERVYPICTFPTIDQSVTYRVDWRGLSFGESDFVFDDILEFFEEGGVLTIAVEGQRYPTITLSTLQPNARRFVDTLCDYLHRCRSANGDITE